MAEQKSRKRSKKPAASASLKPKVVEPVALKRLSNVITLSRRSVRTLWNHKSLFAGVIAIYGLLNIIFVSGLGVPFDITEARNQFGNRIIGSLSAYTQLLGTSTSAADQAASVYQLFLTLFVSLALIWTLRQVYAGQSVRIRDAYYKSMYPIVPFILILLLVCVQLIPLVAGLGMYQFVVVSGIATSTLEVIIWLIVAIALALVSGFFIVSSIMALIIVTLPEMTPVKALRLAKKLVAGRRWLVLRKLLFMPLMLLLVTACLLVPVIFLVPPAAHWTLLIAGPLLIALAHSYVYALYRELMGD